MDRVRDYSAFAVGFCGIGYLLLWPFCSPDASGQLFGAALVCGDRAVAPLRWLCALPHPLHLSLPLNLLGLGSASAALARLVCRLLVRLWPRPAALATATGALAGPMSAAGIEAGRLRRQRPYSPLPPLRPVKPRSHFGLRGSPH
ncbi:MAG TPA: hypothetical protein VG986_20920 [Pseudolabrys sp.]|nr:hypothetical protein [Pseudolabrys sp.]